MIKRSIWFGILWILFCSFNLPEEKNFLSQQAANIPVVDATGNRFKLYDLLGNKPIILSPIYTKCRTLCGLISHGVYSAIKNVEGLGKDFKVLSFSFDSSDTQEDLSFYEDRWKMDGQYWKTISASQDNIEKLMQSIGYEYDYIEPTKEFNHPSILIVLTPSGKISRYIYGLDPDKKDIELAVLEASAEKTRLGLVKGFYLRCFNFDPATKTYQFDWRFVISTTAGLLIIAIVTSIFLKSFIISKN
ncbi:MAG TPA: SCO family protein [Niabella sp.]|nr:SCO family protein [Niabella sp.]HOZ96497.1 SCO family protein [Niabella sp.]HQW13322.1 SCO family protein [Niabella sp.]HQX18638.1 SCO family protein [Niabella sp.]HQX40291.1 SCO family protein [Niabella sp.]